jgi:ribosomal protein S18 acetylase RimI-like enzyme
MIEYRFLSESDVERIYQTFTEAFADYQIHATPTEKQIRRLMVRRGVHYDLSVGAFDGTHMAAVMATGYGQWAGKTASYDIFTGVTPKYRGRGVAGAMIGFASPALIERGAEQFVLEALQTNAAAVKAYRRVGMSASRELECFKLDLDALVTTGASLDVDIVDNGKPSWNTWARFWSWEPSWQNSPASVDRSLDKQIFLEARLGKECLGYAVVEPATGELCQVAVAPKYRRRGIGTRLLEAAVGACDQGPIRIINIDAASAADVAFYKSRGAQDFVRQYEMVLPLRP